MRRDAIRYPASPTAPERAKKRVPAKETESAPERAKRLIARVQQTAPERAKRLIAP